MGYYKEIEVKVKDQEHKIGFYQPDNTGSWFKPDDTAEVSLDGVLLNVGNPFATFHQIFYDMLTLFQPRAAARTLTQYAHFIDGVTATSRDPTDVIVYRNPRVSGTSVEYTAGTLDCKVDCIDPRSAANMVGNLAFYGGESELFQSYLDVPEVAVGANVLRLAHIRTFTGPAIILAVYDERDKSFTLGVSSPHEEKLWRHDRDSEIRDMFKTLGENGSYVNPNVILRLPHDKRGVQDLGQAITRRVA